MTIPSQYLKEGHNLADIWADLPDNSCFQNGIGHVHNISFYLSLYLNSIRIVLSFHVSYKGTYFLSFSVLTDIHCAIRSRSGSRD
jgi:hypothetical protein